MSSRHGNRQKYENTNPLQRALIGRFQRHVLALIRRVAPATILDVGCGEGYTLKLLRDHGVAAQLSGIDLDARALAYANEQVGDTCLLEQIDAKQLAARAQTYDLVLMLEVLEHIEHPGQMLPILAALTRGPVLLSVPREPFFRGLNLLRGRHIRAWGNDPEHINHWGRRRFFRFIEPHFDIVAAPPAFPWTLVLAHKHNREQ